MGIELWMTCSIVGNDRVLSTMDDICCTPIMISWLAFFGMASFESDPVTLQQCGVPA